MPGGVDLMGREFALGRARANGGEAWAIFLQAMGLGALDPKREPCGLPSR